MNEDPIAEGEFDSEIEEFNFDDNGELVWRAVKPTLPNSFFIALIHNLSSVSDLFLAAFFFTQMHVAAVAIATPILVTGHAFLLMLAAGAFSNYMFYLGRGRRKQGYETLTTAFILIAVIGMIFAVAGNIFGREVSSAFGAVTPALEQLFIEYFGTAALTFPLVSARRLLGLILNAYGYHRDTAVVTCVFFICDIVITFILVLQFPTLSIAALGLGSAAAAIIAIIIYVIMLRRRHIHFRFRFNKTGFQWKNIKSLIRGGFYTKIGDLVSAQTAAVVNTLIARSSLGPDALAMYSAVWSIVQLSRVSVDGVFYAISSMQGFCYAIRDFRELKALFRRSLKATIKITITWEILLLLTLPFMMKVYLYDSVMNDTEISLYYGTIFCLVPAPAYAIVQLLKDFYDTTEQEVKAFIYAVIPGSLLLPLMLAMLLPTMGLTGMWIALGCHTLLFLLFEYTRAKCRKEPESMYEKMVYAEREQDFPAVECIFTADAERISALSEQIHEFMNLNEASSRVSYMIALCVDEVASQVILDNTEHEHRKMELKIVSDGDFFRIIIVYDGEFTNPMDHEYSNDDFAGIGIMMVQKIAEKINFSYVYQMNVITMIIRK